MDLLQDFSHRIETRLAAVRESLKVGVAHFERSRQHFEMQLQEFELLARRVMGVIVRPRVERMLAHIPDASLAEPSDAYRCSCQFGAGGQSRATAALQVAVNHDARLERFELLYEQKVVPAFFPSERHDKLVFDLVPGRADAPWRTAGSADERIDEPALTAWLEDHLLYFVETYARLEAPDSLARPKLAG
ncbi:MAG TPA: hypothetical protein VFE62_03685 [Gemmataceae bacterium]|nr:hypothetical protein [Pirellulales bacterium]HZZ77593.1 hypothetical protein [Gemmataceae bacterium]